MIIPLRKYIKAARTAILMLSLLLACSGTGPYQQDGSGTDEKTLKALFVYNFTKHLEWPPASLAQKNFVISVIGQNEIQDRLQMVMKGRRIFDRNVEIRSVKNADEAAGSQIVFVPKGNATQLQALNRLYADKPLLIITEEKGMIHNGACINIIEKDSKLKFEISEINMKKKGIRVSNNLLELAIIVE